MSPKDSLSAPVNELDFDPNTKPTPEQLKAWNARALPVTKQDFLSTIFDPEVIGKGETGTFTTAREWEDSDGVTQLSFTTRPFEPNMRIKKATHFNAGLYRIEAVDEKGKISRVVDSLNATVAIIVDDVGEKAKELPVKPSWVIETKPGSFQHGYILEEPITDLDELDQFLFNLGVYGFTDPGTTKLNQVFRLPGSLPPGKLWPARLRVWQPDNIYTLEQIKERAKITEYYHREVSGGSIEPLPEGTDVACPLTDWVFEQDWHIGPGRRGFERITCPWCDEHSDGRTEAGFHPPTPLEPWVGFTCFHGHCRDKRHGREFIDWAVEQGGPRVDVVYGVKADLADADGLFGDLGDWAALYDWRDSPTEPTPAEKTMTSSDPIEDQMFGQIHVPCDGQEVLDYPSLLTIDDGVYVPDYTMVNVRHIMRVNHIRFDIDMVSKKLVWRVTDENPDLQILNDEIGDDGITLRETLKDKLSHTYRKSFPRAGVQTMINAMSPGEYSPAVEWMNSLPKWDGVKRLEDMIDRHLPSEHPDATRRIMRSFILSAVQAAHNNRKRSKPIEVTPILIGRQGTFKTTFVREIVPEEFVRTGLALKVGAKTGNVDDLIKVTGCWIGEFGELATTFRQADMEHLKNFLSDTHDIYRKAYRADEAKIARTTIWIATSNDRQVLHDVTGNRRFGAIHLIGDAIPFTADDRALLWAEALTRWQAGEAFHLSPEDQKLIADGANAEATEEDEVAIAMLARWGDFDDFSKPLIHDPNANDCPVKVGKSWVPMSVPEIETLLIEDRGRKFDAPSGKIKRQIRNWLEDRGAVKGDYRHPTERAKTGRGYKKVQGYRVPGENSKPADKLAEGWEVIKGGKTPDEDDDQQAEES